MIKINYYFIEETNKNENYVSILGKGGKHLYMYMADFDWWDIQEYGFLEYSKANALAKRYDKTRPYAEHKVKEIGIDFDSEKNGIEFVKRFIVPHENQKVVNKVLMELGDY